MKVISCLNRFMRHDTDAMANADPVKPINGKKLILICGFGSIVFAAVMGFGTYFAAQLMTPFLQKHSSVSAQKTKITPVETKVVPQ